MMATRLSSASVPAPAPGAAPGRPSRLVYRLYQVALLCATISLSGCSVYKFAYHAAPDFIVKGLVGTFELSEAQKKQTRSEIVDVFAWHRKNELPRYVQFLDQVMAKTAAGLSREELLSMQHEVEQAAQRVGQRLLPGALLLLSTLSPTQVAHLEQELKKKRDERAAQLALPEQEYVARQLKQLKQSLRWWLGSYTDSQLAQIELYIRNKRTQELGPPPPSPPSDAASAASQPGLRAYTERSSFPGMGTLSNWMLKKPGEASGESKPAEPQDPGDWVELVMQLDRSLSTGQRQHLLKELRSLRNQLNELASES